MRYRVTHFYLFRVLDARDNISYIACPKLLTGYHIHLQHTHFVSIILHTRIKELHLITLTDSAVHNFKVGYNTSERVEHRVENQRLQGSLFIAYRVRYTLHYGIQDILYTLACLS